VEVTTPSPHDVFVGARVFAIYSPPITLAFFIKILFSIPREVHYWRKSMNLQDFEEILQKYGCWLYAWLRLKTCQFKSPNQTDEDLTKILAEKTESLREVPWEKLCTNEEVPPMVQAQDGVIGRFTITIKYHIVAWEKTKGSGVRYGGVDQKSSVSVHKLLMLLWTECEPGNQPHVIAAVEHVYKIDTASLYNSTRSFTVYPCEKTWFETWINQHKDEINKILAERKLTLSDYSVVALT
jgi:hypothetical protein